MPFVRRLPYPVARRLPPFLPPLPRNPAAFSHRHFDQLSSFRHRAQRLFDPLKNLPNERSSTRTGEDEDVSLEQRGEFSTAFREELMPELERNLALEKTVSTNAETLAALEVQLDLQESRLSQLSSLSASSPCGSRSCRRRSRSCRRRRLSSP